MDQDQPATGFFVRYLSASDAPHTDDNILGAIGFGAGRPAGLGCPFGAAYIAPIAGPGMVELWCSRRPVRYLRLGRVDGAVSDGIAFGLVALNEGSGLSLRALVEAAYLAIFDFLDATDCTAPIRFWNYLPEITGDLDGLERYRHFNIGRDDAFQPRLKLPLPPVASALGGQKGKPLIYFLAAPEAARTIENPRQVSAYAYPPVYGPRRPRFSRAAIHDNGGVPSLLISGTASIVGHESRHPGDPVAQTAETLENIRALIAEATRLGFPVESRAWVLKVYIRHAEHLALIQPRVEAAFAGGPAILYLRADICRPELLVEIEAACFAAP